VTYIRMYIVKRDKAEIVNYGYNVVICLFIRSNH